MIREGNSFYMFMGINIRLAGNSTKVCPVCGRAIRKGMYAVAISDYHKAEHGGKFYSPNCVYIHTFCFNKATRYTKEILKEKEEAIKHNILLIGSKLI